MVSCLLYLQYVPCISGVEFDTNHAKLFEDNVETFGDRSASSLAFVYNGSHVFGTRPLFLVV